MSINLGSNESSSLGAGIKFNFPQGHPDQASCLMTGGIPPSSPLISALQPLHTRFLENRCSYIFSGSDIKQVRGREVHTKALCSDAVNGRSKHWPIMALYGKRETLSRRQIACTEGSCFSPRNRIQHLPDIMKYDLLTLTVLEYPSDGNL